MPVGVIFILIGFLLLFSGGGGIETGSKKHYEHTDPLSYDLCQLNDFYGPRCEHYRREGLVK